MTIPYPNRISDQNVYLALKNIIDALNRQQPTIVEVPEAPALSTPAAPPLVASGLQGSSLANNDFVLGAGGPYLKDSGFSVVPILDGGTGATTAAGARANLGITGTGDVTGPSSSVNGDIAVFNGTTGKIIKDLASPGNAAEFLNGATPPAFALVTDADLSLSNITTNDVSIAAHGFAPKAPNDATKFLDGTGTYSVPAGSGGSSILSQQNFRLTLSSGNPIYKPLPATPISTNTGTGQCTFAAPHGWTSATIIVPSATIGGLSIGTRYFIHAVSATVVSFHTTVANALAGSSPVTLTGNVTVPLVPSGVSNTTLYFSPLIGQGASIQLYNGSSWAALTSAEVSMALGTLTANLPYDVFAFNNSGTLTLALVAWTSDTARATALVSQNGIWVESGTLTNRYVGTIRTDTTTTTIQETGGIQTTVSPKMFVWNMDNRVSVSAYRFEPASSWTTTSAVYRQANGSAANQIEVVNGLVWDDIQVGVSVLSSDANSVAAVSVGEDSTTTPSFGAVMSLILAQTTINGFISARVAKPVPIGHHVYTWLECGSSSGATFYGDDGLLRRQGLTASWLM